VKPNSLIAWRSLRYLTQTTMLTTATAIKIAAPQAAMAMTAVSPSMVASLARHWANFEALWTRLADRV
jgi:hypothetical protein